MTWRSLKVFEYYQEVPRKSYQKLIVCGSGIKGIDSYPKSQFSQVDTLGFRSLCSW